MSDGGVTARSAGNYLILVAVQPQPKAGGYGDGIIGRGGGSKGRQLRGGGGEAVNGRVGDNGVRKWNIQDI